MKKPVNLERKLDEVFSKWVRFSNAKKGYCVCVSCGKIDAPERMDAGHFVDRAHHCLRWDERNVQPQCRHCNRFKEGQKDSYALFLVRKYGANILEELNNQKHNICQFRTLELEEMIKDYKEKLKQL
jgi:hypothetical protein